MKKKLIMIITIMISISFASGIAYSMFNSEAKLESNNSNLANFVFNDKSLDEINIDLTDLHPDSEKTYSFQISNNIDSKISDTKIIYQLTMKTYHFIPVNIDLYKLQNDEEIKIGSCDETYTRNSDNEIVCNMPEEELDKDNINNNNYILKVSFPAEYNDIEYSNLVDFIKIEINSHQKV